MEDYDEPPPWPTDGPGTAITAQDGPPQRQSFAGVEHVQSRAEIMATALSAAMTAQVQARYVMALKRPRQLETVTSAFLAECRRPSFADKAIYRLKRGSTEIEGPTIRFAEAAMRAYGNLYVEIVPLHDDEEVRMVQVTVTDLESNDTIASPVIVNKTVERNTVKQGQIVRSVRENSRGAKTYLVDATEAEVNERQNSQVSRVMRNGILRFFPGGIREAGLDACRKAQKDDVGRTLDKSRLEAAAWFALKGVDDAAMTRYLGHPLTVATADEIVELRQRVNAINAGELTIDEMLEARNVSRRPPPPPAPVVDAPADGAPAPVAPPATPAAPKGNAAAAEALRRKLGRP